MAMSNMGDTNTNSSLTKVFVGGLAWETQTEAMRTHFQKYGQILEAVIIFDKATGRSKGYGFVTFKEVEAAKKACEDASPMINGRRANCNLASLGAKRPKIHAPPPTTPKQGGNLVGERANAYPAAPSHVQWYYPPPSQFDQHHQPLPLYGYHPAYIAPHMSYNHQRVGYTCGSYMNGQVYPGQPMYPFYQYQYHYQQPHTVGLPAHMFPTTTAPITPFTQKPTSITPNTVCLGVE